MNSKRSTIRTGIAAMAATGAIFSMAACGTEIQPPAQDIGSHQKQEEAPDQPARTSIPRGSFGDEYGQAKGRKQHEQSTPAGSGTRNRMNFRDGGF